VRAWRRASAADLQRVTERLETLEQHAAARVGALESEAQHAAKRLETLARHVAEL
jgi:hypothetical protein